MLYETKPIAEWTFQELVSHATWDIIQGFTRGTALYTLVHQNLNLALQWKAAQESKT